MRSNVPAGITAIAVAVFMAQSSTAFAVDLPEGVDPETGFRMDNYRAPTPDFVPGGKVVDTAAVKAALGNKSSRLVDVYAKGVLAEPVDGAWKVSEPHETIPGAVWVPHVGYGKLKPEQEAYFRANLQRLTDGDTGKGLIFFCMADCWHSWNAAKRASEWGYTAVGWYSLGSDGWKESGGTLVPATPEPIPTN